MSAKWLILCKKYLPNIIIYNIYYIYIYIFIIIIEYIFGDFNIILTDHNYNKHVKYAIDSIYSLGCRTLNR